MRYTRRAVALALLFNLAEHRRVVGAFAGPVLYKHSTYRKPTSLLRERARAASNTSLRCRVQTNSLTVLTEDGIQEQQIFSGGAEKIAEHLAKGDDGGAGAFYNRVGVINRDLSVLMATVLSEERLKERDAKKNARLRKISSPVPLLSDSAENETTGSNDDDRCNTKDSGEHPAEDQRQQLMEEEEEEGKEGLVVLDAFAASGVRALRYLTEVPGVRRAVANDFDAAAIDIIRQAGDLCGVGEELEVHRGDALDTMYAGRAGGLGAYDLIDIDPFGCAAGFLDAGVQAVTDGGLLCVTSTDMPVLSGAQPTAAFARYGSVPTRGGYHHEMSLRILLHAISAAAGRHRRSIKPVLSVAIDHYVRVFVRVLRSPKAALAAAQNSAAYVLQSEACPSFFMLPVLPNPSVRKSGSPPRPRRRQSLDLSTVPLDTIKSKTGYKEESKRGSETTVRDNPPCTPPALSGVCPETGSPLKTGGPIWSGPLHDEAWVTRAIALASSIEDLDTNDDHSHGEKRRHNVTDAGISDPSLLGVKKESLLVRGGTPRPRLTTGARLNSLLKAVSRELLDVPLFYNLRDMFATMGLSVHPQREQVMGALEAAGYRTSSMHKEPLAVKTDAPDAAVWDVLRCWVRDNPQPSPRRAAGLAILSRGPQLIFDADFAAGQAGLEDKAGGVSQGTGDFLHTHNPEKSWGPISRGSAMVEDAVLKEEDCTETPALLKE